MTMTQLSGTDWSKAAFDVSDRGAYALQVATLENILLNHAGVDERPYVTKAQAYGKYAGVPTTQIMSDVSSAVSTPGASDGAYAAYLRARGEGQ